MREIIYIQAGSLSNYTGTHYWNTQENYFVYDENHVSIIDHNISFKEGRDDHNQPTLYPRVLAFDQKSNFGTLAKCSHREEIPLSPTTWHGIINLQEQEQIPQSEYHSLLENTDEQAELSATKIRYWSDFSRVFFDPKSIHGVPDMSDHAEGNWNASHESFLRYDDDVELMDGSLRLLVEDCNNFQGAQIIHDTSFFGGFTGSLLSAFREEYPKATVMTFTCLSNFRPFDADIGDSFQVKQVLNDILSLRNATEFCDLTVPILSPPFWERGSWVPEYSIDNKSLYQSSAVLSTYIETATFPLRLKDDSDNLQTMAAHLNWRKSSPLAALGGTLCSQGLFTESLRDIPSLSFHANGQALFARRDVSRGLSQDEVAVYNTWNKAHELERPLFMWHHFPSCPVPTSFPPIFPEVRPQTLKVVSSLSTSPSMGSHISGYASFVESAAKRRDSELLAIGLEDDEVKELINALWDIVDGYGERDIGGDSSEGMGEGEE